MTRKEAHHQLKYLISPLLAATLSNFVSLVGPPEVCCVPGVLAPLLYQAKRWVPVRRNARTEWGITRKHVCAGALRQARQRLCEHRIQSLAGLLAIWPKQMTVLKWKLKEEYLTQSENESRALCVRLLHQCSGCGPSLEMRHHRYSFVCCKSTKTQRTQPPHKTSQQMLNQLNVTYNVQQNALLSQRRSKIREQSKTDIMNMVPCCCPLENPSKNPLADKTQKTKSSCSPSMKKESDNCLITESLQESFSEMCFQIKPTMSSPRVARRIHKQRTLEPPHCR